MDNTKKQIKDLSSYLIIDDVCRSLFWNYQAGAPRIDGIGSSLEKFGLHFWTSEVTKLWRSYYLSEDWNRCYTVINEHGALYSDEGMKSMLQRICSGSHIVETLESCLYGPFLSTYVM